MDNAAINNMIYVRFPYVRVRESESMYMFIILIAIALSEGWYQFELQPMLCENASFETLDIFVKMNDSL
jgi:hypothetical protein